MDQRKISDKKTSHVQLQHKTICRLIKENGSLQEELTKAQENARVHAAYILHDAINLINSTKGSVSDIERRQFIERYMDQTFGSGSIKANRSSRHDTSSTRDRPVERNRTHYLHSDELNNGRNAVNKDVPIQSKTYYVPNRSHIQRAQDDGSYLPTKILMDEGRYSNYYSQAPSTLEQVTIETSAETSSNSRWDSKRPMTAADSVARELFLDSQLGPVKIIDSGQAIKPWTTTQCISIDDNGIVTRIIVPEDSSTRTIKISDQGVEIMRVDSPQKIHNQSGQRFSPHSATVESGTRSSGGIRSSINSNSPLAEQTSSTLKEQSKERPVSLTAQSMPINDPVDPPATDAHTVWDIPNDNYKSHRLSKTTFYGTPMSASTPTAQRQKTEQHDGLQRQQPSDERRHEKPVVVQRHPSSERGGTDLDAQKKLEPIPTNDVSSRSDVEISTIPPVSKSESLDPSSNDTKGLDVSSLLKNINLSRRVLGEIAFQLDRRMINHVFNTKYDKKERKRLYGYSVGNIESMIQRHAINHDVGSVDVSRLEKLNNRYEELLKKLQPLGYNIQYHADFTMDVVNRYGLLPLKPGPNDAASTLNASDIGSIYKLISKVAYASEMKDMTIVVDCLAELSREDGKPMISW